MKKIYPAAVLASAAVLSSVLGGCGSIRQVISDGVTEKTGASGMKQSEYVLSGLSSDTAVSGTDAENIAIAKPAGTEAAGDTDTSKNAYVSFYHASTDAKSSDYVMTYRISGSLEKDREETEHTYSKMYENFIASDIEQITLKDGTECRYYTATYMLGGETLTDYIFEIPAGKEKVTAKLGTTFYPLSCTAEEAGEMLKANVKN